ncbi:zinc transporter ZIP5 [Spea bombifrons]|uniref:zinc transporter ZIP5 n=1 Tax=Spea bombifrons TaxID=233779 RepID=UPI00234B77A4|nr:zinc transporter ZIP5 [Spea bombifrons]
MVPPKAWLIFLWSLWTCSSFFLCQGKIPSLKISTLGRPLSAKQTLEATNEDAETAMSLENAEKEQGYYLRQLFHLYGENDTLTYHGLTLLLQNLGLGKVQVVEIQHTELGHDHVAHLDILDVQENKHSHVHSSRDHLTPPTVEFPFVVEGNKEDNNARRVKDDSNTTHQAHHRQPVTEVPKSRRITIQDGIKSTRHQGLKNWHSQDILEQLLQLHHSKYTHQHENCLNVTQLLLNFGLDGISEITPQHFTLLCPALLYQIDSRVCIQHNDQLNAVDTHSQPSLLQVLGWGALAVTLVSAPSLLAIALIPLLRRPVFRYLLRFLVALAVGTLCGDALLHLLPHAQENHTDAKQSKESHSTGPVLKGLCVLGGIYLLFLIENVMGLVNQRRKRKKNSQQQRPTAGEDCTTVLRDLGHAVDRDFCEVAETTDDLQRSSEFQEEVIRKDPESHASSHHGHSHSAGGGGIADFVWMVLLGDGIHNFTDGLAIGAAFSAGFSGGISTTVAVFCHELPHELGDFAVLLQTGVPVRRILFFSLVSVFLSFMGMVTGTMISSSAGTPWIFAATAGIFLYVALVDMLPQMLLRESSGLHGKDCFIHSIGFLLGGIIMLCIALFQDHLEIIDG